MVKKRRMWEEDEFEERFNAFYGLTLTAKNHCGCGTCSNTV
jgi:hypothetical protein